VNAERLKEIVDLLVQTESIHRIQGNLEAALQNLNNMIGNPNSPNFQKDFIENLQKVKTANQTLLSQFTSATNSLVQEIGAKEYFIDDFAAEIMGLMQSNPLTPAITQERFNRFVTDRARYIEKLIQLQEN
jgi:hypothetical protein